MKKKIYILNILFCLSMFVFSCKTKQLIEAPSITIHKDYQGKTIENESSVYGKVINKQQEPLTAVAIKFVLNEELCLNAYSNFEGDFYISYDTTKITQNSYLEIVYKDYTRKIIPFDKLEKETLNKIQLEKGDLIVTKEVYEGFYHEIRNCRW